MLLIILLLLPLIALGREWNTPHDAVFWGLAAVTVAMIYSLVSLRLAIRQARVRHPELADDPQRLNELGLDMAEARTIERWSKVNMISTVLSVLVGIYVLLR